MTGFRFFQINKMIRIEEVIGRYLRLYRGSKSGKTLQCHCPFHFDKPLSFKIKVTDQIYECECCHEKGDVLDFLQSVEGCSRSEAIDFLVSWYPLERQEIMEKMEEEEHTDPNVIPHSLSFYPDRSPLFTHTQTLFKMIMDSLTVYRHKAPDLTDAYEKYKVGVAPKELPNPYSDLENCLIFPLYQEDGIIRALVGLPLGNVDARYISVPAGENCYFLFGLSEAREAIRRFGYVYLMHDYEDVIVMKAAGFSNVVSYGGMELYPEQISILANHTQKIVLVSNKDITDQVLTYKAAARLNHSGLISSIAFISSRHTMTSLFIRDGKINLRRYVQSATRMGWLERYRKYLMHRLAGLSGDLNEARDLDDRIELFSVRYRLRTRLNKVNRIIKNYYPNPLS